MNSSNDEVFALYVEKELVGKRVKGSKVKITWKFAFRTELKTHEIELKHSLMSGKREIKVNGVGIFSSKKFFSGPFEHPFRLNSEGNDSRTLAIKIEEGREGYAYDLIINGRLFQRHTRISMLEYENLRKRVSRQKVESNSAKVNQIGYGEFVKKDTRTLDGVPATETLGKAEEDDDPFGWSSLTKSTPADSGIVLQNGPVALSNTVNQEEFNPFEPPTTTPVSNDNPFDPYVTTSIKPTSSDYERHYNSHSGARTLRPSSSAPMAHASALNDIIGGLGSVKFSNSNTLPMPSQASQTMMPNVQTIPVAGNISTVNSGMSTNLQSSSKFAQQRKQSPDSLIDFDSFESAKSMASFGQVQQHQQVGPYAHQPPAFRYGAQVQQTGLPANIQAGSDLDQNRTHARIMQRFNTQPVIPPQQQLQPNKSSYGAYPYATSQQQIPVQHSFNQQNPFE